jgi:hypothetical protein
MIDFNTQFTDQKGDVVKQNYKTSKIGNHFRGRRPNLVIKIR